MRRLWLLALVLTACVQPGAGLFYSLGELRLRAFQDGDANTFEFLGTNYDPAGDDGIPFVNGTRSERWSQVADPLSLHPPPGFDTRLALLRLEWRTDFSGFWSDVTTFYLTQDADDGALTLHAVGLERSGGNEERIYWLDEPGVFMPPLEAWRSEQTLSASLTRYDASGQSQGSGNLELSWGPPTRDVATTPMGRFESLQSTFRLSLGLPDEAGFLLTYDGAVWIHPALGTVRYQVQYSRLLGSEARDLSLDRVELTGTNIPLPEPG